MKDAVRIILSLFIFSLLLSCKKDSNDLPYVYDASKGFPEDVAKIINTKCNTTGCHTANAKAAAGGLSMETWDQMFEGSNGGAVTIPYRPDYSWIMYYTNTDTAWGPALTPNMPYNAQPLSIDEWNTLNQWVINGAPKNDGSIAFPNNADRKKFYVANQGCDVVTVFDADTKLAMRYVNVGNNPDAIEVPHQVKVSPDGKYWYVCFVYGTTVQKFSTLDDSYIGEVSVGVGYWNTMTFTSDGSRAWVVDWENEGRIAYIDLDNLTFLRYYQSTDFVFPHGSEVNAAGTVLYITAQYGNQIFKFDVSDGMNPSYETIPMDGLSPNNVQGTYDPHQIYLSPDESKYFVTCQASNEVRVFKTANDSLIKVIPVGQYPLEMAFSNTHSYMFVTCEYDPCAEAKCEGSVYVIDYNTFEVKAVIQSGIFQPHGIGVLDNIGYAVVASRNLDVSGPLPHHTGTCGGRNGFIQLIDLTTLQFIDGYRSEVSVDPYSVGVR
ncbi:MAG: YncE family protein [Chitinophagales bacterium]|nr:YncE family protein [Chitinophagales bacterium]